MGTIVYQNLVELLLEEGDKSKEEIVKEAIERFGFPDEKELNLQVSMQLIIGRDYFKKLENGKYNMVEYPEVMVNRKKFLELFKDEDLPMDYFEQRPWILKLKSALENNLN